MRAALDPKVYDESLFDALIDARARYGDKEILEDQDRHPLTYTGLIRAAFVLGRKIAAMTQPGERVGVLLPSSAGVVVTFFGLHAFGRVPVMLNFTSGEANLKAALKTAGVTKILSAKRFVTQAKLDDLMTALGEVAEIIWLDDVRKTIGLADKLYGLSAGMAPRRFRVKTDPDSPGVVLFTSGSFGAPKGVVLSQRNLVANARQVATHIDLKPEWVMFNPLPTFHSLGLTGGVILPLLQGMKAFEYPSPLHAKQITDLLPQVKASILFATDTFLNQYARVAEPDDFATLQFVVAGAEKVRDETRQMFNTKFGGVELLEGYGATEAAPVVAVNHPDRNRPGTVGQIMPGMEYRLDTVPGIEGGGQLFLRGPNVMAGYISPNDPKGIEPLAGGWHDTGDIVDIDDEGYITILGRVKRFAKVGGEMVSLLAVEDMAGAVWPDNRHAAVSVPDSKRGERLILVTDHEGAASAQLSEWARDNGAPELAVPKKIIKIAIIPVLGTGKTDYVAIQKLVEDALKAV
ncbi:acyl-[acyl-carrier-protein]-phospholipid O-acyltransferase/long-chain-fatty-acid--[acyl-carrier-protein] ligase [Brevundimonas bullata]|uniref:Acyl-[acyl-carrier-protein]-phospholipid O-acyltransferase/long-chain-fatty-acid--[acyl-carrier-protein] ligase n=1 Tax=Brevundimonas bullata TaxID=13160 RepID=A0A7W7INY1_9CAUL|nr:AMP-binding protein [Brevundimonas bullata]MBB4797638.1 acyl-[acyl-carrier-protein]-phospholipid O-acyltransferase/long-chain-fatty-acid--[acyl-carrier-protein] ligase [Brevundimonas bullata]MBB6382598.1 acyl-[acyl-carrier-protein]-phospholipid O-acyltransferase/long-chain-fatty-acid--[acyl-carrier-protein] ligase [Brevundimonas bullata]